MKYFISMHKEKDIESIKRRINKIDKKAIIYIDENHDNSKVKEVDIIVCNNDKNKIDDLKKLNKSFFIYMPGDEKEQEDFIKTDTLSNLIIREEPKKEIKKKKSVAVIATIIIVIITLLVTVGTNFYQKFQSDINHQEAIKKEKQKLEKKESENADQKASDIKKENYVFLGDSITEIYHLDDYYSSIPHINSGTSAYTTDDILKHMEDYVYIYNPTKVILLIGTNDVQVEKYNNEELVAQIQKIVNLIQKNRPKAEIYVESIYPVNNNPNEENVNLKMIGIRKNNRII